MNITSLREQFVQLVSIGATRIPFSYAIQCFDEAVKLERTKDGSANIIPTDGYTPAADTLVDVKDLPDIEKELEENKEVSASAVQAWVTTKNQIIADREARKANGHVPVDVKDVGWTEEKEEGQ